MMIERTCGLKMQKKKEIKTKSPKDLRYNDKQFNSRRPSVAEIHCILWLATHKQHTHIHIQIQANIGNQIEEEE